jgi:hypothetical protein
VDMAWLLIALPLGALLFPAEYINRRGSSRLQDR